MARGSPERPKWGAGRSRRGVGDAEQAERRFLRILAAGVAKLRLGDTLLVCVKIHFNFDRERPKDSQKCTW